MNMADTKKARQSLGRPGEYFAISPETGARIVPQTADAKNRTVDVVWYGGATVPRIDPDTGDEYMLRLDMAGCRMERLNSGAPVFDNHMSGQDFRSIMADRAGTKAQVGVVQKAWADGNQGKATLKFRDEGDDDDTDQLWSGIQSGIVNNLSFGTWIYDKKQDGESAAGGSTNRFVATDWEPFEISPVTVPADFTTQFLSAAGIENAGGSRASVAAEIREMGEKHNMSRFAESLVEKGVSVDTAKAEFARAVAINSFGAQQLKYGLTQEFLDGLVFAGVSEADARARILAQLATVGSADSAGTPTDIRTERIDPGRDAQETKLAAMQAAILLRFDSKFYAKEKVAGAPMTGEAVARFHELAREYRGFSLYDMARESLELRGSPTRGKNRNQIVDEAMAPTGRGGVQYFGGGAETSSDFPGILANVANKTLRQAYEAWPQTYQPFCRQVTAPDFKPINRAQLNDIGSLMPLNEKGEYKRAILNDSIINYSLGTFGNIVAITRKAIINDDLQAFTRISALLGVAAAQRQSDIVWGIVTNNTQLMQDGNVLFSAPHNNLLTGASSALTYSTAADSTAALTTARATMRQQKGPNGTHLNLVPRFIAVGTALETPLLKLISPMNIASSDVTKVVPDWVRSITPIVESRLDATAPAWYVIADPAQIDTIEYCFLEGQEGVYFETRMGYEVDGVELKARMDFAAAAIEQRGLLKCAGQ